MKRVIVNIINDLNKISNLEELLPKEFEVVGTLREQGVLESLYIKDDRTGAVLVMKDVDVAKAKELVSTFPLFQYFDEVVYITVDKA